MGLGVLAWGSGCSTTSSSGLETVPVPSLADAGYLMVYPPVYAALMLLYRSRIRGRTAALWIDGAIGASRSARSALQSCSTRCWVGRGGAVAVATNLSYPVADVVHVRPRRRGPGHDRLAQRGRVGGGSPAGWRCSPSSDSLYFYGIAVGTYQEGVIYDAGWPAAVLLLAYGAWTPASPLRAEAAQGAARDPAPIVFAVASLALLIYDHFHRTNVLALALASPVSWPCSCGSS